MKGKHSYHEWSMFHRFNLAPSARHQAAGARTVPLHRSPLEVTARRDRERRRYDAKEIHSQVRY